MQEKIGAREVVNGRTLIIYQLVQAEDNGTISNVIQQVFIGDYELLRDAYIRPGMVFERVNLEQFVGRDWLVDEIDRFLNSHDRGYFILEADAGLGKTTFLAWLVRSRGYIHHFCELAPGAEGVNQTLKNLATQLILEFKLGAYEVEGVIPGAATRSDYLFDLLKQAADKRKDEEKIVLVIDALDEAGTPYNQNVLGLPNVLPKGVYIIVSQKPVSVTLLVDRARTPRKLYSISPTQSENQNDIRYFLEKVADRPTVNRLLQQAGYSSSQFVRTMLEKSEGVWVYLHYIIHEIEHGERSSLKLENFPKGLTDYYLRFWHNWRDQDVEKWDKLYLPLLSMLAAIQEPCNVDQLCEWSGLLGSNKEIRRLFTEGWRPFLLVLGEGQEANYRFYHVTLNEFFEGRSQHEGLSASETAFVNELAEATRESHDRISSYFLRRWGTLENAESGLISNHERVDEYALRHILLHLYRSGQIAMLHKLIEYPQWAVAKPLISFRVASYLDDLNFAFQLAVDDTSDEQSIVRVVRYMLQIKLAQHHLGPSSGVIILLAQLGEVEWALKLANLKTLCEHAEILVQLANSFCTHSPEQALEFLEKLACLADGSGNLFNQCGYRCKAAQTIARLGLSPEKATALTDEALAISVSLSELDALKFKKEWVLPIIVAFGGMSEAMAQINDFSPLERCQLLRRFVAILPAADPGRIDIGQRAVEVSREIPDKLISLEQQAYSLMWLAESQIDEAREEILTELQVVLDEIHRTHPGSMRIIGFIVERMAMVSVDRVRRILEEERWHPDAFDAWPAVVEATSLVNTDDALTLLNERLENWMAYRPTLVKIISQVAQENFQRAEALVEEYRDRLDWHLNDAYLGLAKAAFERGSQEEAEKILIQPNMFILDVNNQVFQQELQIGIFFSAIEFLEPEELFLWFRSLPRDGKGYREARQALAKIATDQGQHNLLEGLIHSDEDHTVVAATLAHRGHVAEAKEYIERNQLRTFMEPGYRAHISIVAAEARENFDALNELIARYDKTRGFSDTMVQLTLILDGLLQSDTSKADRIQGVLDYIWPIALNWQPPENSTVKDHVRWRYRREQMLGQAVATMFRINAGRGREMLGELQDSPAQVNALLAMAPFSSIDTNFIEEFKVKAKYSVEDLHERAAAYYALALALPESMEDEKLDLLSEAEEWFYQNPAYNHVDNFGMRIRYELSPSSLRLLKARALIQLIKPENYETKADELITLADQIGVFHEKRTILLQLFRHCVAWPPNLQLSLLTLILKKSSNKGLEAVQATIAASAPILHSIGESALLNELWHEVPLIYRSVISWVEASRKRN